MSQREHATKPPPMPQPIPPQPEQPEPDDDEDNGDDGNNGKEKENASAFEKSAMLPFHFQNGNSFAKEMPNSLARDAIARVRQSKTLQQIFSACEVRSSMLAASLTWRSPGSWLHRSDNQLPNSLTYG